MDWRLQWRIQTALRTAERERNERKIQLLAEILGMVPNPDKALGVLADSTIENLEVLARKLRKLRQRKTA
jgi:hypothetical protein